MDHAVACQDRNSASTSAIPKRRLSRSGLSFRRGRVGRRVTRRSRLNEGPPQATAAPLVDELWLALMA